MTMSLRPLARAASTNAAWSVASLPPPGAEDRRKRKSVHAKEAGQSLGLLKLLGSIGMTRGSCHLKAAFHVMEDSRPNCARSAGSERPDHGKWLKARRTGLSDVCEVKSFASARSISESPPESMGTMACQSSSSEGMQVGCRQKPATGMPCASPHMSATPVSVKALMIRSTLGAAAACSWPRWCMKTGAEAKKLASEAASISSCSASDFEPMISFETQVSVWRCVSPPEQRKRTAPAVMSAHCASTHAFQRASVQMVTSQPRSLHSPRARATKGWTSPRVPRVIRKAWRGYEGAAATGCSMSLGTWCCGSFDLASASAALKAHVRRHGTRGEPLSTGLPSMSSKSSSCCEHEARSSARVTMTIPTKEVLRIEPSVVSSRRSSLSRALSPHACAASPSDSAASHTGRTPSAAGVRATKSYLYPPSRLTDTATYRLYAPAMEGGATAARTMVRRGPAVGLGGSRSPVMASSSSHGNSASVPTPRAMMLATEGAPALGSLRDTSVAASPPWASKLRLTAFCLTLSWWYLPRGMMVHSPRRQLRYESAMSSSGPGGKRSGSTRRSRRSCSIV
mmetsp:Transcript_9683/g.24082  ORF Transcript_9683/g.24082 Transcript_9683/m.24082 type:complete len:568 (-) Transcript_9683:829-2532(-)